MDNVNIKHAIKTGKLVSYSLLLPSDATDPSIVPVTAAVEAVLLYHLVSEADRAELTSSGQGSN